MKKIKLEEIIEAIEICSDEANYYYNKKKGYIICVFDEEMSIAEGCCLDDLEEYPEWQREGIENAIDVEENWEDYISLPDKNDINEYRIMENFCYSVENKKGDILLNSIKGRGAFRRFKEKVNDLNLSDSWYKFREEELRNFVIEWCKDNNIK